jgi:hypothetical protein
MCRCANDGPITQWEAWVFMGALQKKLVIASDSVAIANLARPLCLCAIASFPAMTRCGDMGIYGYFIETLTSPHIGNKT